jgi:hypothetical protein
MMGTAKMIIISLFVIRMLGYKIIVKTKPPMAPPICEL